jgi:hypothetical protein
MLCLIRRAVKYADVPFPPTFRPAGKWNCKRTDSMKTKRKFPMEEMADLTPLLSLLSRHLSECFHTTRANWSRGRIQALARIEIASWGDSITCVGGFHASSVASDGLRKNTFSFNVPL